jgi:hypothetical protein
MSATADQVQHKRGLLANIPVLLDGQFGYATDTNQLFIGSGGTNKLVGGGAGTYVPDGGTISGTYYGGVYSDGSVILSGTVEIFGDLSVQDVTAATDLAGVLVFGNCLVNSVDVTETTVGSISFDVYGDLTIYSGLFQATPSATGACTLNVLGDLHTGLSSAASITLTGYNVAGGNLTVGGNIICPIGNGTITSTGSGGFTGGAFFVGGDVISNGITIDMSGTDTGSGPCGLGGSIVIQGDFKGNFSSGNAGNLVTHGGNYTGSSGPGGSGGNITVGGDCFAQVCNTYGGAGTSGAGNGGALVVGGNLICPNVFTMAGAASAGPGGSGGSISVGGNLISYSGQVYTYGGSGSNGSGGNAGNITVQGSLLGEPELQFWGNDAGGGSGGPGGNAGNLTVYGDLVAGTVTGVGGGCAQAGNVGGTGGNFTVYGTATVAGDLTLHGGQGNGSHGGVGGTIYCKGSFVCSSSVDCSGGDEASAGVSGAGGTCTFFDFCAVPSGTLKSNSGSASSGGAGAPGSINLFGGANINILESIFGAGAQSGNASVALAGTCIIQTLNLSPKSGNYIYGGGQGATLKTDYLAGVNVLTNSSQANPTAALTSTRPNLYSYSPAAGAWYVHAGTAA